MTALVSPLVSPPDAVRDLWSSLRLDDAARARLDLSGIEPAADASFAVGTAIQISLAAAALAATEVGRHRNGVEQRVAVDMRHALLEATGAFTLDGRKPEVWDKIAGLYPCGVDGCGGWVRLHTNFAHHRDGVLRLLGLPEGPDVSREAVALALVGWTALQFEAKASAAGMVVAAVRTADEWRAHPQFAADAAAPLVEIERIGDAPPLAWPTLAREDRPLTGLRVLDLTRILAGPVGGRTLAAYGADVMLVNSPRLPNIEAIADTSRGKRSALADLHDGADRQAFADVLSTSHVVMQGYRPGGLAGLGFGPDDAARIRPGIVYASLSAYGSGGPWADRRGFDSLVQSATGLNDDEARAAGVGVPKALPVQVLDMATGFLLAWAIQAALLRQHHEGGSWHARLSLARTAIWLRSLGRIENGSAAAELDPRSRFEFTDSGFGLLGAVRHAAVFERTPASYPRPPVRPGTDALSWR